jgi:hypothetical protein
LLAKIYGSNPSFQCQILRLKRLSGWGRTRTRGEGGTNERKLGQGNLVVAFESKVSAKIHGSEVGAKICASDLDTMICGSELGAKICDADVPATSPRSHNFWRRPSKVQRSVYISRGLNVNFLKKKTKL